MGIRQLDSLQTYVHNSTASFHAKGFFSVENGFNLPTIDGSPAPGTSAAQCGLTLLNDIAIVNRYNEGGFVDGLVVGMRITKPVGIAGFGNPLYSFLALYPLAANTQGKVSLHDPFNNFSGFFNDGYSHLVVSVNGVAISGEVLIPWAFGDWHYLELGVDANHGTVALRVDGVEYFRSSGHSISITQDSNLVTLTGQVAPLTAGTIKFQDVYIADAIDGLNFYGPCQVLLSKPSGTGSVMGFTGVQGNSAISLVDETTPDFGLSAVESSNANVRALFTHDLSGPGSILAVQCNNIVANRGQIENDVHVGDSSAQAILRVGSEELLGSTHHLPTRAYISYETPYTETGYPLQGWINTQLCSETAPDGSSWSSISSLEAGVRTVGLVEVGTLVTSCDFSLQTYPSYIWACPVVEVRAEGLSSGTVQMELETTFTTLTLSINMTTRVATITRSTSVTLTDLPDNVNFIFTICDVNKTYLRIYDATTGEFFGSINHTMNDSTPDVTLSILDALSLDRVVWVTEGFIDEVTIA